MHQNDVLHLALRTTSAINCFLYTSSGQLIPLVLKLFEAKQLAQILYGTQAGICVKKSALKTVQKHFSDQTLLHPMEQQMLS